MLVKPDEPAVDSEAANALQANADIKLTKLAKILKKGGRKRRKEKGRDRDRDRDRDREKESESGSAGGRSSSSPPPTANVKNEKEPASSPPAETASR